MWSSWAWVMTTHRTSSRRWASQLQSGKRGPPPSMSSSGKHQPAVDQRYLTADFDGGAVAPDLAETTEKSDPDPVELRWRAPSASRTWEPFTTRAPAFMGPRFTGPAPCPGPP